MRGVGLGQRLVAQDAERQHRGADGTVVGDDRGDQRAVRGQVVGVELHGVDGRGPGRLTAATWSASRSAPRAASTTVRLAASGSRELDPDFAAAAQDHVPGLAPVSSTAAIITCASVWR